MQYNNLQQIQLLGGSLHSCPPHIGESLHILRQNHNHPDPRNREHRLSRNSNQSLSHFHIQLKEFRHIRPQSQPFV